MTEKWANHLDVDVKALSTVVAENTKLVANTEPNIANVKNLVNVKRRVNANEKPNVERKNKKKQKKRRTKKRRTKKRQRGGSKMLNSSNYPNPLPKGGPWSPGSDSNGLGKGYYYKNNTDPFLPNPQYNGKSFNMKGGGFFDLAKNLPGGTDLYDAYWKGSNVVKNTYQTWKGGKQYVDPNPSVQPSLDKPPVQYSPAPDLTHITKTSQTKAAAYDNN